MSFLYTTEPKDISIPPKVTQEIEDFSVWYAEHYPEGDESAFDIGVNWILSKAGLPPMKVMPSQHQYGENK